MLEQDRLEFQGRELHWLPRGSVLDTALDWKTIERKIGPTTTRAKNTIQRLAKKHFGG